MKRNMTVCLAPAGTINYPQGGGQLSMFLNWALGLQELGCNVLWLEPLPEGASPAKLLANLLALKRNLAKFGLADSIALFFESGAQLPEELDGLCMDLDTATEADLLLELRSEEHTSELQSLTNLVCRLLLEKKK